MELKCAPPMVQVLTLYMDDSGTRYPDHPGSPTPQGYDWFGLGGVLVHQDDEQQCRTMHEALCQKWRIDYPLHSVRIRNSSQKFAWIGALEPRRRAEFYEDLTRLIVSLPVLGIACVIDRPGYNHRYRDKYAGHRWHLCKTGFAVVVERAAKHALRMGCKLNVAVEESDKVTDRAIREYYAGMKASGPPFDAGTSISIRCAGAAMSRRTDRTPCCTSTTGRSTPYYPRPSTTFTGANTAASNWSTVAIPLKKFEPELALRLKRQPPYGDLMG